MEMFEHFKSKDAEQAYTMYILLIKELQRIDAFCSRIDGMYPK